MSSNTWGNTWKFYSNNSSCTTASTTASTISKYQPIATSYVYDNCYNVITNNRKIEAGDKLSLPDGSTLIIDDLGNPRIEDVSDKIVYKANNIREFSPFINASDMVAGFLDEIRDLGIKRDIALNLPIKLFIKWLIIKAAEKDGDSVNVQPVNKDPKLLQFIKPKCNYCGKYIRKLHQINEFPYCGPEHALKHLSIAG